MDNALPYPWVKVLVYGAGTQGIFIYGVPEGMVINPGYIVAVPLRDRQVQGIALQATATLPPDLGAAQVRPVDGVISTDFLPESYWQLLRQVADYYRTPLYQVVRVALPPGLLSRSQQRLRLCRDRLPPDAPNLVSPVAQQLLACLGRQSNGDYAWSYLKRRVVGAHLGLRELHQRGWVERYLADPKPVRPKHQQAVILLQGGAIAKGDLSDRQQEILSVLQRRGGEMWLQELLQTCRVAASVVKTLAQKEQVTIQPREVLRFAPQPQVAADQSLTLTAAQAQALEKLQGLAGFGEVLLHGITGSGKTEVYLQAIAPVLDRGQTALVLVPEIGLTPQLTDRFRARFGPKVHLYHSALEMGERYDTWRQMLRGDPQVVIGTRSAVFAPLPRLGLIILDEEHDPSFKQDQPSPCYHARTVARWRAASASCPLVLGSATPALETWVRHQPQPEPDCHYLALPERIQSRPLPPIEVVDMRQELQAGHRSIFSRRLQQALTQLPDHNGQGILFIHRRGHSTFVSCRSCGNVLDCPHCDVSLAYHHTREGATPRLRCHYCNYGQPHPRHCPACGSPYLKYFGAGTQRVTQELSQHFPQLRWLRFDSDTTRTKGSHRALLTQFGAGDADLLVGTQMLTKGIDLPQVTLVGIVAADGLLHLSDFRASERAFQTLTQVAGRAGRAETPGRVILQTYTPEHPVIQAVQGQNYPSFVAAELQQRAALHYPPYGRLVLLRLSSLDAKAVEQGAEAIAQSLQPVDGVYELLGPAPAQILRVAQRYRWQILLKFKLGTPVSLPDLETLRSQCPRGVRLTLDLDPLNLAN